MFEKISPPAADKIIRLMAEFAADPRPDKVDLGVGVFRNAQGQTPVLDTVRAAEARILSEQSTKSYVSLSGDPAFCSALSRLILGPETPSDRIASCATAGGTGAVRQALEIVKRTTPEATIWVPDPSWPNHAAIIGHLGLSMCSYRYFDAATGDLDRDAMMADLAQLAPGDVVILHGCCHNPTGADLTPQDWRALADILAQKGALPLIDLAYLGFGQGLEADAFGVRHLAAHLPELLIAASCSKNFGLYRERVGLCLGLSHDPKACDALTAVMAHLNRQSYAFPPDHGARVVQTILDDPDLSAQWRRELGQMRETITENRQALAHTLAEVSGSTRFDALARHQGMFSLLPAGPDQVAHLRDRFGVYVIDDGRMNVAGLGPDTIPYVARAIAETLT